MPMYHEMVRHAHSASVLLVEDNQDEEMLVIRALKRASLRCNLITARTTDQAIEALTPEAADVSARDQLSVVITDLRIGPKSGADLVSLIRSMPEVPKVPVVVFSGSATDSEVDDLYRRGANSFLEKPTDFERFAKLVVSAIEYWAFLNTLTKARIPGACYPYPL